MPMTRDEMRMAFADLKHDIRRLASRDDDVPDTLDDVEHLYAAILASTIDRSSLAYKKYQGAVERVNDIRERGGDVRQIEQAERTALHFARVLIEGEGYQKGGGE